MKPCELCRWTGSTLPGGYSTVIINPSLPGNSFRSLEKSSVTFASGGAAGAAAAADAALGVACGVAVGAAQPATRQRRTGTIALVVIAKLLVTAASAESPPGTGHESPL